MSESVPATSSADGGVPLRPGFDHSTDRALREQHYQEWNRLREDTRAFRSDIGGDYNLWFLLRYDDINTAFQDYNTFSSHTVQYLGEPIMRMIPIELDPPDHTKFRRLLNGPLSPGRVRAQEDHIRSICASLIDPLVDVGSCDFLRDFSRRFPTQVFLEIMGLPAEHVDLFVARAHAVLHGDPAATAEEDMTQRLEAALEISGDIATAIAAHRDEPADDLLTTLIESTVDGRPLTDDELNQMGFLLYLAGLDTVANVMAYSFHHLALHPETRAALTNDPALIVPAVDEFLRCFSIATTARQVTRDVDFAGCPMKAGDRIVLPTASGSRDGRQFDRPDELIIERSDNRHLAFGAGPHRCVGAHLARIEMIVAFEEWHRRIPDYRIADDAVLAEHVGAVAGLENLPLVWD